MDKKELISLGEQLRGIGHRRRELAERVYSEVQEGDTRDSRALYEELAYVTTQAIGLMEKQRTILQDEIAQMPVQF